MRAVLRILWLSATLASAYMPLATPRSGIAPLLRAPIPQPASRVPRLVASAAEPPRPSNREAEAPRRTTPPVASAAGEPQNSGTSFELYDERWLQLGYLSLLALLSDWVCFSVAAAPETWEATYAHDPATLIDIFLFTNVFFCFAEPAIVRRVGLRNCIVGAAIVMSSGCALRSGIPLTGAVPSYPFVVAGTMSERSPSDRAAWLTPEVDATPAPARRHHAGGGGPSEPGGALIDVPRDRERPAASRPERGGGVTRTRGRRGLNLRGRTRETTGNSQRTIGRRRVE